MLRLLTEFVGNVIFIDVAHIGSGFSTDPFGGYDLHVVEPFVGVEPALYREFAHTSDIGGAGIVGGHCEKRPLCLTKLCIGKVAGHDLIHILGATVNIRLELADIAYLKCFARAGIICMTPIAPARLRTC